MSASRANRLDADGAERRKAKRYPVDHPVPLTAISGGKLYTCHIVDVSIDGVRLQFEGQRPQGKVLALDHPTAGTLCGTNVWSSDDSMGVELLLPKRELERLLKCICLVL